MVGVSSLCCMSKRILLIHTASHVASITAMYLADDNATVFYFFEDQEIGFVPR